MNIKTEETGAVTIELDAKEAGHIAADILAKPSIAGKAGEALAVLLRDQGFFLELTASQRTEWAGPEEGF